jgi:glycosyltransferase involved in cell wall biosynthesis
MPAYRVTEYIGAALDSVFAQTFTDYEIIVVNDGCPDTAALEQVLGPYLHRIVYLKQENQGTASARNTAIRASRGRYLALLDSDDLWEPTYLGVQLAIMERDPTLDVLYPDALLFGEHANAGRTYMEVCPSDGEVTFARVATEQCQVMISVLARRSAIVAVGLFDESLRSSEDFDLWLRILSRGGRIAYHRQVLARYRLRPASLSADPIWMCASALRVLEKSDQTLPLRPEERACVWQHHAYLIAMRSFYEGKRAFLRDDHAAALKALADANTYFRSGRIRLILVLLRRAPRLLRHLYGLREMLREWVRGRRRGTSP